MVPVLLREARPKVGAKKSWKGVLHTRVVPFSCGPNVQKGVVVAEFHFGMISKLVCKKIIFL